MSDPDRIVAGSIVASRIQAARICPMILRNRRREDGSFTVAAYIHPEKTLYFLADRVSGTMTAKWDHIMSCLNITFELESDAIRFQEECCSESLEINIV